MKPFPEFTAPTPPALSSSTADRAYQGVTIVAMILLLVTLWAF